MSKARKKPAARAKTKAAPKKTVKSAPKLKKPKVVARPAQRKKKPVSKTAETRVPHSSPPKLQPDVTAPPPPIRAMNRPRRVSIGEALAQLNAATLEGVTAEITPFGLTTEVALTPTPGLAALLGAEARPLSVLVSALEEWGERRSESGAAVQFGRREHDGELATTEAIGEVSPAASATSDESANLILVAEATSLLAESPRSREALEGFVKRNCRL